MSVGYQLRRTPTPGTIGLQAGSTIGIDLAATDNHPHLVFTLLQTGGCTALLDMGRRITVIHGRVTRLCTVDGIANQPAHKKTNQQLFFPVHPAQCSRRGAVDTEEYILKVYSSRLRGAPTHIRTAAGAPHRRDFAVLNLSYGATGLR